MSSYPAVASRVSGRPRRSRRVFLGRRLLLPIRGRIATATSADVQQGEAVWPETHLDLRVVDGVIISRDNAFEGVCRRALPAHPAPPPARRSSYRNS